MRFVGFSLIGFAALLSPAVYGWAEQYTRLDIAGAESQAIAINSKQEALVIMCNPGPCTAALWSEKGGLRTIPVQGQRLNDRGEVAGVSANQIFFWSEKDGVSAIAAPAGGIYLVGLNDHGELAGNITTGGHTRAFVATEREGIRYLAPASATDTVATRINGRGEVVGTMLAPCTGSACYATLAHHAFLWTSKDGLRDLGTLNPDAWTDSYASDVNDHGDVAGYLTGHGTGHAFLWTERDGMQDLGCPPGIGCSTAFLAGDGIVVGNYLGYMVHLQAFIWTAEGGMRELGSLPGARGLSAQVNATNGRGVVVGNSPSMDSPTHAFVWTEQTGIVDLDPAKWPDVPLRSSWATAVNDKGVIAGSLDGHACIWIPAK